MSPEEQARRAETLRRAASAMDAEAGLCDGPALAAYMREVASRCRESADWYEAGSNPPHMLHDGRYLGAAAYLAAQSTA